MQDSIQEQLFSHVDIGGDIFNMQIRDKEGLWLPLVKQSYVTYRETKTEQNHDTSASSSCR